MDNCVQNNCLSLRSFVVASTTFPLLKVPLFQLLYVDRIPDFKPIQRQVFVTKTNMPYTKHGQITQPTTHSCSMENLYWKKKKKTLVLGSVLNSIACSQLVTTLKTNSSTGILLSILQKVSGQLFRLEVCKNVLKFLN